ncbi:MAG: Cytidine/deoxycytidylate deaminase, zinc-binding region [Rhodocyclaceae bacterium]|nr:Cytidine/deoxycytidylate deaminase, zinc-binding region [Rhodocyclaceae bacterium]
MDEIFLQRAIELAHASVSGGDGGPFGAVVVKDGEIIGEGRNRVIGSNDPTAHAEIAAIRSACARLGRFHLADCVLYASSEPCPMCLSAAYWARLQRIVFANTRDQAAAIGFCDDALYDELRLPHAARSVPTCHLPIPGAAEPLRRWHENPGRTAY